MSSYSHRFNNNYSILTCHDYSPSAKYLFLDRDGVLIEDVHYISDVKNVKLCPKVSSFLYEARRLGYCFCVVTNQSSVAQNIISIELYLQITFTFLSFLEKCLWPDLILASFYHPSFSHSSCRSNWRKPHSGMFDYVLTHNNCDVKNSIMIGDKHSDLLAAHSAGISKLCHVTSPLHTKEAMKIQSWSMYNNIPYKSSKALSPEFLF